MSWKHSFSGSARLVALARRLGSVRTEPRPPEPARTGEIPPRTYALWGFGGTIGLILILLGAVTHNAMINTAGVVVAPPARWCWSA